MAETDTQAMDEAVTTWEELLELEPGLGPLEEEARAIADDGTMSFFCSNFVWLPLTSSLQQLIGVRRRGGQGKVAEPLLYDSRAYEVAYLHLSPLLPPCRDCGCHRFQPLRDEQTLMALDD